MREDEPLKIAIVGAGLMGRWHAYFAVKAGATIAAVVDPNTEAAKRLAQRFRGAATAPALESALREHPIDVVHICVPTSAHFPLAYAALSRQRHVLVEKPMTASAAETEELVSMARARGLLISPVHQFARQQGVRQLRREVERLGTPVRVTFTCCTAGGRDLGPAERSRLLVEILPHPLSLFYGLFGERVFERLEVVAATPGLEVEIGGTLDDARIGAAVSLRGRPTEVSLTYVGTEGSGYVDLFHGFYVGEAGRVSRRTKLTRPLARGAKLLLTSSLNLAGRTLRSEWAYPGLSDLIREFYGAIQRGQPPPIEEAETIGTARALDRLRRHIPAAESIPVTAGH